MVEVQGGLGPGNVKTAVTTLSRDCGSARLSRAFRSVALPFVVVAAAVVLLLAAGAGVASSSEPVVLTGGYYPAWSRDGTKIVFAHNRHLVVMSSADGSGKRIVNARGGGLNDTIRSADMSEVKWAPARRILFSQNTWVESVDSNTGRATRLSRNADSFTVSRDGRQVALVQGYSSEELRLVSVTGGHTRVLPKPDVASDHSPEFSPDAQAIAFVRTNHAQGQPLFSLLVEPIAGGEARTIADLGDFPRWSPDGRWIAFRRVDLKARTIELDLVDATGGTPRVLFTSTPQDRFLTFSWSPDSRLLAYGTRSSLGTIDLNGQRTPFATGAVHYDAFAPEEAPHWSSDGTRIAFTGFVGVYQCKTGIYVIRADGIGLRRLA
jgi:dipeptidyl aminopeptidase/acylaminoacyl peptidase